MQTSKKGISILSLYILIRIPYIQTMHNKHDDLIFCRKMAQRDAFKDMINFISYLLTYVYIFK